MANKLKINLEGADASAVLDSLQNKANQLEQTLQRLAGSLGKGAMEDPTFRGGLQELMATQGAITSVRSLNASAGVSGSPVTQQAIAQTVAGGSIAAVKQFGQIPEGLSPAATILAAQQLGQQTTYTPQFSGQQFTASVLMSAAVLSRGATAAGAEAMAVAAPVAASSMILGPNGMPLPAAAAPQFMANGLTAQQGAVFAAFGAQQAQPFTPFWQRQGAGMWMPAAFGAEQTGAAMLDWSTQRTLRGGGINIQQETSVASAFLGTLAGIGVGIITRNPLYGIGAGMAVAGGTQSILNWLTAPAQNLQTSNEIQGGFTGTWRIPGVPTSYMEPGVAPGWREGRFRTMQELVNPGLQRWAQFDERAGSPEVAKAWTSLAGGLFAGGIDPYQKASGGIIYPIDQRGFDAADSLLRGGHLTAGTAGTAAALIRSMGFGREEVGEMYTRRIARIYGNPNVAKIAESVAPIFATLPETGGNVADILAQYGPKATIDYFRIQNENLALPEGINTPQDLSAASATIRGAARSAAIGSLQARGSGQAARDAYQREMESIAGLPGGRESLAFSEAAARARDAGRTAFEQRNLLEYAIPASKISAAEDILSVLPYSPSNRMSLAVSAMRLNRQQIARLSSFMEDRRRTGNLSEQEETEFTGRILGLQVQNAQVMATLSEGWAERLPAMMAGRPAFMGRLDSAQLASLSFMRAGMPRRSEGAINGRQLRGQDEWLDAATGGGMDIGPWSRTSGINAGNADQVVPLLQDISQSLRQLTIGGPLNSKRPAEVRGQIAGGLDGARSMEYDFSKRGYN